MARHPRKGLSSSGILRALVDLSPPMSRVRMMILCGADA